MVIWWSELLTQFLNSDLNYAPVPHTCHLQGPIARYWIKAYLLKTKKWSESFKCLHDFWRIKHVENMHSFTFEDNPWSINPRHFIINFLIIEGRSLVNVKYSLTIFEVGSGLLFTFHFDWLKSLLNKCFYAIFPIYSIQGKYCSAGSVTFHELLSVGARQDYYGDYQWEIREFCRQTCK